MCWGKTALIVDGITIHDPAAHQVPLIATIWPGDYSPMPLEVGVMRKDGTVVGFASKNMGLHQKTVQCLLNVTDFGMSAIDAAHAAAIGLPDMSADGSGTRVRVVRGDFSPDLPAATGLDVFEAERSDA